MEHRQVVVAYSITYGRRADGWWYAVEIPGRTREEHGPFVNEDNVIAAKLDRMRELEEITERRAEPGERCTCAARPSSCTSAASTAPPGTAASVTVATAPGRARSAVARATRRLRAAARTTDCVWRPSRASVRRMQQASGEEVIDDSRHIAN